MKLVSQILSMLLNNYENMEKYNTTNISIHVKNIVAWEVKEGRGIGHTRNGAAKSPRFYSIDKKK